MPERPRFGEVIRATSLVFGLLALTLPLAFSHLQREAILQRDGLECQAPFEHDCGGELQVHHILPQRYLEKLKVPEADFATNGITLCEHAHQVIHPDMEEARNKYRQGDHNSYYEMGEERNSQVEQRKIYWNPQYDRQMTVVALRNTQQAEKGGWKWPDNGHKKST